MSRENTRDVSTCTFTDGIREGVSRLLNLILESRILDWVSVQNLTYFSTHFPINNIYEEMGTKISRIFIKYPAGLFVNMFTN